VRRGLAETPGVIEYGELRIDTAAHEVTVGATPVGRGNDGEGPLSEQDLWDAFGAKKNKQKLRITDALDRLDGAGLIERRGRRSIASEVAKNLDRIMTL
jgi:hypothetical protein